MTAFHNLGELLPAALYTCDAPSGRITFYNAEAAKLWGRAPDLNETDERFCGSFRLWRPDGSALPHDRTPMARALLEGRAARNEEVIIERPDGSRVAVVVNIDPVLDADGQIVGAINIFHETSVLRHTAEARAQLAAIVESSDDAIISENLEGIITSWNAGAERLFGYTGHEAIGRSMAMLIPSERHEKEPDILDHVRRGEEVDHYETVRRRKDGALVEIWLCVSPIVNEYGAVIGASTIARDMTERNRVLKHLSSEQEAMSRLYEIGKRCAQPGDHFDEVLAYALDTAIWIAQADKGALHLHDEESQALRVAIQRGFDEPLLDPLLTVAAGHGCACTADRVIVEDVTDDPILADRPTLGALLDAGVRALQSMPLVSSHGTLSGIISTHHTRPYRPSERECQLLDLLARQLADYLERKRADAQREKLLGLAQQAREEAEAANRAKDEFLAMLSHELRNPLSAVRNAVVVAALDENQRARALEVARRQTDQLARLVDDLLDVARITRGHVRLRRSRLSLGAVLQRAVDGARALMEERGHSLTLSAPAEEIYLEGDAARLEQVVANLLSNSAKYTNPGGKIEVLAERSEASAVIRVRDNGFGIPPDLLPRIFDLFAQGSRSLDRTQGGLGIGLTLVRRIVELHGGTVQASSPGIGGGAEFLVSLPALPASAATPGAQRADLSNGPQSYGRAPIRALIVEDNRDAADMLVMLLEILGHHARSVSDGPAALEAAQADVPDLMLVDIGLPGMNGYELATAIRGDAALKHVVLVALTGYGRPEDKAQAIAAGFDEHLAKPVETEALVNLFASVAASTATQRTCA